MENETLKTACNVLKMVLFKLKAVKSPWMQTLLHVLGQLFGCWLRGCFSAQEAAEGEAGKSKTKK